MSKLLELGKIYALVMGATMVMFGTLTLILGISDPFGFNLMIGVLAVGLFIFGILIIWAILHKQHFFVYYENPEYKRYMSTFQTIAARRHPPGHTPQGGYQQPPPYGYSPHYPYPRHITPYIAERHSTDEKLPQNAFDIPHLPILLGLFLLSIALGFTALFLGGPWLGLFPFAFIIAFSFPSLMWISYVYFQDLSPEPGRAVLIALTWGMLSVNVAIIPELAAASLTSSIFMLAAVSAPLAEEFAKPLALPYLKDKMNNELDGLIYGVSCGMGFAMIENMGYSLTFILTDLEAGTAGVNWAAGTLLRGLFSTLGHAVGAGLIGYAYARYRLGKGSLLSIGGAFLIAVGLHAGWNGSIVLLEDFFSSEFAYPLLGYLAAYALMELLFLILLVKRAKRAQLIDMSTRVPSSFAFGRPSAAAAAALDDSGPPPGPYPTGHDPYPPPFREGYHAPMPSMPPERSRSTPGEPPPARARSAPPAHSPSGELPPTPSHAIPPVGGQPSPGPASRYQSAHHQPQHLQPPPPYQPRPQYQPPPGYHSPPGHQQQYPPYHDPYIAPPPMYQPPSYHQGHYPHQPSQHQPPPQQHHYPPPYPHYYHPDHSLAYPPPEPEDPGFDRPTEHDTDRKRPPRDPWVDGYEHE